MTNEISRKHTKYKRGEHPISLKNLKPFPKGNNFGQRDGYTLTSALKYSLNKPLKKPTEDAPVRDHIVYATLEGALQREPTPFNTLWDRVEGKLDNIPPLQDNRTINILVSSEKAKELTENIGKSFLPIEALQEGSQDNATE